MESSKHPAVLQFLAQLARTRKENEASQATAAGHRPQVVIQLEGAATQAPHIYREHGKWQVRLPSPPVRPSSKECCGSGCSPCIFDTFRDDQKQHREHVERIEALHARLEAHASSVDIEEIIGDEDSDVVIVKPST
ncbi:hypothetical protein SYNPS1DRAFT_31375 [Syncephalis pseudoplumigaleata]|uniref:Oxidoreductase-like domain-containing protein n=1 Tax=Syncephalis pseudoplumigaleata TaxID=1712513 RepID=A0A4P9YSL7_9FUNG|nr:hypothetical protein SYNPS1DRAFT_31375 [Syncephalis pseudoplumigaleata]|eukprot:RKP22943.1 hypothetical protein SYNPS1DRAFT_31375 [Syncephalis pseudoplumigaleata]